MAEIIRQRMTHQHTGELVVFLIGMRVNQFWRLRSLAPGLPGDAEDAGRALRRPRVGLPRPPAQLLLRRPAAGAVLDQPRVAVRLRQQSGRQAPTGLDRVQPPGPPSTGCGGIWHETFEVEQAESIYVGDARHRSGQGHHLGPGRQRRPASSPPPGHDRLLRRRRPDPARSPRARPDQRPAAGPVPGASPIRCGTRSSRADSCTCAVSVVQEPTVSPSSWYRSGSLDGEGDPATLQPDELGVGSPAPGRAPG